MMCMWCFVGVIILKIHDYFVMFFSFIFLLYKKY